jgi:small subunit ribosomal protein S6
MAVKRLYEGMFLVDSTLAAADWEGTLAVVETILKRADAEVVVMRKWDERRLAYDIEHKSRGTYILTYFKADTQRIGGIEKDVQLNEKVMRVLILTTEGRPQDMIDRDIAGLPKPAPVVEPEPVGEGRRPMGLGDEGPAIPGIEGVSER